MHTIDDLRKRSKYLLNEVHDQSVREFFNPDTDWPIGGNHTMRLYVFVKDGDIWYGDYNGPNAKRY